MNMNQLRWSFTKGYYRSYQMAMKLVMKTLKYPKQRITTGAGSLLRIPSFVLEKNMNKMFIVCSKSVRRRGLLDELLMELKRNNITYTIFDNIQANPTIENVEQGYELYRKNQCEGIIAIGGGSPMDCAKIIGIKVSNPNITYEAMKHMTAIKKAIPYMIAVPTTAGTGSESSVGAVLTNPKKREKYAIISLKIMPADVILDEQLTIHLPKDFTAYTGMDALTHAIKAYIGRYGTKYTDNEALIAIKLIFDNLEKAYKNGEDIVARRNMLIGSNHAANAFTRAYTGYVHTISHAISALYNVGHGKTNAIILPYVLQYYGKSIENKLADIAIYTGIGKADEEQSVLASKVIKRIQNLNLALGIPNKIEELRKDDIEIVVKKALKEGNPAYPVPKLMNSSEGNALVSKLLPS